eukprot:jgi/Mesen1/3455/ME000194S02602
MEDTLTRMEEAGLKPDMWTYNTLIGAYGAVDMPYACVKVVREMQEHGFTPDKVTYKNLIMAFTNAGDYLEAARWSLWMQQAGYGQDDCKLSSFHTARHRSH